MKINHYLQHITTKQNDPTKSKRSILTVVVLTPSDLNFY